MQYGTGSWDCESLGNHRAVVRVDEPAEAVWAHIEWRRRDKAPQEKNILVVRADTEQRVHNVARVEISREFGDLAFEAPAPGDYYVYYMPYRNIADSPFMRKHFSRFAYEPAEDTADAAWLAAHGLADLAAAGPALQRLPRAETVEIQAINDFHRFDPMEIIATGEEVKALLAHHADRPYLVFPEDRRYPIRMRDDLPKRWIDNGLNDTLIGQACRGECYAFQLGIFAARTALEDVGIEFTDGRSEAGDVIPAEYWNCINLGGTDWLGRPIRKQVSVAKGKVQPLWCWVRLPADAAPGEYRASATIQAAGVPQTTVNIELVVTDKLLADAGDTEPWRYSRLRWLNSTTALDDEVFAPYTPVELAGRTVRVLGRELQFADSGLPEAIRTTFPPTVDRADAPPTDILAAPMRLVLAAAGSQVQWRAGDGKVTARSSGAVTWRVAAEANGWALDTQARVDCDGYVNYKLTLTADEDVDVTDIALEIPFRREAATYMMGLGRPGGRRPREWKWRWNIDRAQNQFWLGDVNAGLNCKLKHVEEDWSLTDLHKTGLYRHWSNGGRGGCELGEQDDGTVLVRVFTGPRRVAAGEELHFNFALLITPVKVLDKGHWQWRYMHESSGQVQPPAEYARRGARIVNVHHSTPINPNINYPFLTQRQMADYATAAHASGLKFKIYYTVRELTNFTTEIWALRSLGDEVFVDGPGVSDREALAKLGKYHDHTGDPWLCEHLADGYVAAWQQPLGPGKVDAAIETAGLSRWHNYYIEGLRWLLAEVGIDGLYLDGIGYDREIMKRVRKVMQAARPGSLIDFHSGNGFDAAFGGASPACQYAEHFPYIDSLWFGEGFDYDNVPPDYWLVEVSGIPFGLFGEMLQGGGNPWRGMLYGMTGRLGWGWPTNPAPMWALWDEFGIAEADMIGYWAPDCPVRTDCPDVPATVYRRDGRALVSVASWAGEPVNCRLIVDWGALEIDPATATITAPAIEGFQPAATFAPTDPIPIDPKRGGLLVLENA